MRYTRATYRYAAAAERWPGSGVPGGINRKIHFANGRFDGRWEGSAFTRTQIRWLWGKINMGE